MNAIENKIVEGNKCFLCKSIQLCCVGGLMGYYCHYIYQNYKKISIGTRISHVLCVGFLGGLFYINCKIGKEIYDIDKLKTETFWEFYKRQCKFKISNSDNKRKMITEWNNRKAQELGLK